MRSKQLSHNIHGHGSLCLRVNNPWAILMSSAINSNILLLFFNYLMPNTINSRGRSSKNTGGYVCTSPHPMEGTDDSVQENHPMRWAGRGPYRSDNARGAGMGLCVLPGFQFRLSSPSKSWFGLCGLLNSSAFLGTRNHSNFRKTATSHSYTAGMVPFHLHGDPGRHVLSSFPLYKGEQGTERSNNLLSTTQQLRGRVQIDN